MAYKTEHRLTLIGYVRVGSVGQPLDIQGKAPTTAGSERIHSEKRSGRSAKDGPELVRALDHLRHGNQLIVTRRDRLARSEAMCIGGSSRLMQAAPHSAACSSQHRHVDRTIPGAVAEFGNDIRRQRQRWD